MLSDIINFLQLVAFIYFIYLIRELICLIKTIINGIPNEVAKQTNEIEGFPTKDIIKTREQKSTNIQVPEINPENLIKSIPSVSGFGGVTKGNKHK